MKSNKLSKQYQVQITISTQHIASFYLFRVNLFWFILKNAYIFFSAFEPLRFVSSFIELFSFFVQFPSSSFCGFGKSHFYQFNSHPIFDLHFVDHPISSILTDEIFCI